MTFDGRVECGPSANTTDLSCIDEDEIVHIEIVGKRKVYSEAAYNKVAAHRDRLRDAALAYQELATCYRIGKRPTEKLFERLRRAHAALQEAGNE